MTLIAITPSTPRRIAAFLDVTTVAQRLLRYLYLETRLMEAQAGWIVSVPIIELKIELGYQLYTDACHVNVMRERLPEGWKVTPSPTRTLPVRTVPAKIRRSSPPSVNL